jgi:hypothetical protein
VSKKPRPRRLGPEDPMPGMPNDELSQRMAGAAGRRLADRLRKFAGPADEASADD